MRALTISAHGGLEQLEFRDDLPTPELRRRRTCASAFAPPRSITSTCSSSADCPASTITPPWILGADACGVVDAVGARRDQRVASATTSSINPGISDRTCEYCHAGEQPLCVKFGILGEHLPGTIAEYIVVPATNVRAIPRRHRTRSTRRRSRSRRSRRGAWCSRARGCAPASDVLIWGIGGGVALAALQICKQLGAEVWVTSSSDEKLARAGQLGAIDDAQQRDERRRGESIRKATGKRGIDVVVDNVGEATWTQSLHRARAARPTRDVRRHVRADGRDRRAAAVLESVVDSGLDDGQRRRVRRGRRASCAPADCCPPVDSVFPLEDGRAAFERLATGEQFGKVVIRSVLMTRARPRGSSRTRSARFASAFAAGRRPSCPRDGSRS